MKQYLGLLKKLLKEGESKADRTGTGTLSLFGEQIRFDLSKGFPLVTTKKVHTRSIIFELLWMLRGDTNIKYLNDNGVRIWNAWADKNGDLGPIYSHQWRKWGYPKDHGIDQIAEIIEQIKNNPDSRRLIVSAWNPQDLPDMALAPCHCFFQFYVNKGKLSCQLYQRSADIFVGVPFNIASYSLLTHMIAQLCNLEVGTFVHTFGDLHLYLTHKNQAKTQLLRSPKVLPKLQLNPLITNIDDFTYEDVKILNYEHHDAISAPVAV